MLDFIAKPFGGRKRDTKGVRRTKLGYSTEAETLESLIDAHPVIAPILEHREISKLKGGVVGDLVGDLAGDLAGNLAGKLAGARSKARQRHDVDARFENDFAHGARNALAGLD